MKKILMILMVLMLVGCQNTQNEDSSSSQDDTKQTEEITSNQTEKTNGTKRYVKVTIKANADKGIASDITYGAAGAKTADNDEGLKSKNVTKLPSSQTYKVEVKTYNGSTIQEIEVTAK